MPRFSDKSIQIIDGCDHHLQILFNEVIKYRECLVLVPHNKTDFKHSCKPATEVDVAPQEIHTYEDCHRFGGYVEAIAAVMNMSHKIKFRPPVHFEVVE